MRALRPAASLVSFAVLILASHPAMAAYPRPLFRAPACLVDVDKPTPAQGEFLQHVTVAEWTGDDLKDLIVTLLGYDGASNAMYDVRFFKNVMATGSPRTFEPVPAPAGFNAPASVVEVLAGDLNGDGRADLVMTDTTTTVWVQLSTGSGLGAAATYIYGPSTKIIRASLADMDKDGRLDVVVHTRNVMTHIDDVSILRNTGGGTLDPRPLLSVGTDAVMGLGDLNVDGRPDVIGAGSGQCTVYLSSGATGFAAPYSVPAAATPLAACVANISDDGNPDLVLLYDNTLDIHQGTGGGLISSSGTSRNLEKAQACGMTPANLDADAQTELVITHQSLSPGQAEPHGTVELLDFAAPTRWLSTGPWPGGDPVIANLDRDGQLDLVVPSSGHQVAVVFGPFGTGTGIDQVISGPAPTMFGTPAVGDFNRDGKPDVAASMGGSTSVLLGNGAGGFPTTLSMSAVGGDNLFPYDMNRDGKLDLLEASGHEYRMRLGNGDGTFASPFHVDVADSVARHPLADMNRDGKQDLIFLSPGFFGGFKVSLGNGTGGFSGIMPASGPLTGYPLDATAADLDRDGDLDLAVAAEVMAGEGGIRLFSNDGVSSFTYTGTLTSTESYSTITSGDLNRDGAPDLVAYRESPVGFDRGFTGLDVYYNNGAGGFSGAIALGAPERYGAMLEIADVNRDGLADIVCTGDDVADPMSGGAKIATTSVYLQTSPGVFAKRQDHLQGIVGAGFTTVADADGDRQSDVLGFTKEGFAGYLSILQGNAFAGGWAAAPQQAYAAGAGVIGMAQGDMNRDGIPDLVTANDNESSVSILLGNGSGGFAAPYTFTAPQLSGVQAMEVADINRDGKLDAVTAGGPVCVLFGAGNGTFSSLLQYPGGTLLNDVDVADYNRDGYLDIAATSYANAQIILHLTGPSGSSTTINQLAGYNNNIASADLNRDGKLDLVVANNGNGPIVFRCLRYFLGNGDGTFQGQGLIWSWPTTVQIVYGLALEDVNRDGKVDIVAGLNDQAGTYPIALLYGNGAAGVSSEVDYPTGEQTEYIQIADLDGDPYLDLISSSFGAGYVSVRLGTSSGTFGSRVDVGNATGGAEGLVVADLDRNGTNDLAVADDLNGRVLVLLNTNSNITAVQAAAVPRAAGKLAQNAPNPFNPRTTIRFTLPAAGPTTLTVYDVQGRRVTTLVNQTLEAGDHSMVWEGRDGAGHHLASGVYFYRLESGGFIATKRMTLLQ